MNFFIKKIQNLLIYQQLKIKNKIVILLENINFFIRKKNII